VEERLKEQEAEGVEMPAGIERDEREKLLSSG
jgi:hypothetical protein